MSSKTAGLVVGIICCIQVLMTELFAGQVLSVSSYDSSGPGEVVLVLSGPVEYQIFGMQNPDRVVIDLNDSKLAENAELSFSEKGLLWRIRHATRGNGDLRLVFDMRDAVSFKHSLEVSPVSDKVNLVVQISPDDYRGPKFLTREEKQVVVAIDAGHGGIDSGAVGLGGTYEKVITLDISFRLNDILKEDPRIRGVLTRKADQRVKLRSRVKVAREKRADLFLSIHADAIKNRMVKGSSAYILSNRGASSELARRLAAQANSADFIGSIQRENKADDLWETLVDLSQKATLEESNRAARGILLQLNKVGRVHKEKVQSAGFMVLKSLDIPSVLIEVAFISNPQEEKKLNDPTFRQRVALAIYRGICVFFDLPEEVKTRGRGKPYIVKRGDTLSGIAKKENTSIQALRGINGMSSDFIREGQVLEIP